MATRDEMQTIEARTYNDTAREMAAEGVTLSYAQSDRIGAEGVAWLERRLCLRCAETDTGLECEPSDPAPEHRPLGQP